MFSPAQFACYALTAFGLTELLLRRGSTAKNWKPTATDRGTTLLILACYAIVVSLFFLPELPGTIIPLSWRGIGAAVAGAGLLVRWWAMLVLGKFYTRTLITASDQDVVDRGPYRWVRHPGYLGSLMTWTGASVALGNIATAAIVAVILLATYARRIAAEEVMLVQALGPGYADYQRRTSRLFPWLF